jgi:hypothetical protein
MHLEDYDGVERIRGFGVLMIFDFGIYSILVLTLLYLSPTVLT